MNRKFYSIIVIIYSAICIYIMSNYKLPNRDVNKDITLVKKQQEESNTNNSYKNIKSKENLKNYDTNNIENESAIKDFSKYSKAKTKEIVEGNLDETYKLTYEDSGINEIKGEFDSFNTEMRKKNQVIKVPVEEIVSCLSLSEKGKLFTISRKLSNEEYDKFQEYLGYKNQKIGMRKALEIIEAKLPQDEVEEVKAILSKFMDMEVIENGN